MTINTRLCALLAALILSSAEAQTGMQSTPPGNLVACDLIEKNTAEHVLESPITTGNSNRKTKIIDGGINSVCFFIAGRNRLKVVLIDFPTEADAKNVFSKYTVDSQHLTHKPEPRLGDAAMWWLIENSQYGYTIRKGKHVYILDANWNDGKSEARAKEKLKAVATSAMRRL